MHGSKDLTMTRGGEGMKKDINKQKHGLWMTCDIRWKIPEALCLFTVYFTVSHSETEGQVYCTQLNKEADLYTDKQGGTVYAIQLDQGERFC